ncbi:substrate-binding periplasmic protein [Andreprevotia chitinilytica]|uniref:substrate-binding periplasmic protein n=1 Tax=Andreprevotia chitinilytica TaxID=396808 RepID=UPI0009FCCA75|nr:transporter substrate-binding domain-containing protein [Andreprevotia chitinilytica]
MLIGQRSAQVVLSVACVFLIATGCHAARMIVFYPRSEMGDDQRNTYPIMILDLALKKSGMDYELKPCKLLMQQQRALTQLAHGMDVDVFWSMTSKQREADLMPIRIPIDKGLLGWRLFLIRKGSQEKFDRVTDPNQLKAMVAAQGHDWPDMKILQGNGFTVQGVSSYESLFKMLQSGRIDYIPRSVGEIWGEADKYATDDLVVENNWVIQYPTAEYFFVNKENTVLASALERGLKIAIRDGSFEKIFLQYYGALLNRANLKARHLLKLANPLLEIPISLDNTDYWFKPS